jgi:hypothetical protein
VGEKSLIEIEKPSTINSFFSSNVSPQYSFTQSSFSSISYSSSTAGVLLLHIRSSSSLTLGNTTLSTCRLARENGLGKIGVFWKGAGMCV